MYGIKPYDWFGAVLQFHCAIICVRSKCYVGALLYGHLTESFVSLNDLHLRILRTHIDHGKIRIRSKRGYGCLMGFKKYTSLI
jgi:hypothetical protein